MALIQDGSEQKLFTKKSQIAAYILERVLRNRGQKIGTEWEMFLVDRQGRAITREKGQEAFVGLKNVFADKGYAASLLFEHNAKGERTIFGVDIEGVGCVTAEMGHQFEFACSASDTPDEIQQKNEIFADAIRAVAARIDHLALFCGYLDSFAATSQGSYRSRSEEWHTYFDARYGAEAGRVRATLDATASTQVSLDSGAEAFHEYLQALLLIEPLFTLHYANSARRRLGVVSLPTSHIKPLLGAWKTRSAEQAAEAVVDRLMELEVPFLPDPAFPEIYKAEPLRAGCPPTVRDLMEGGRLNEKTLKNVGGFLLSRPAVRHLSQGLIEVRGIDAQVSAEQVAELAERIAHLVYDAPTRRRLLADYAHLGAFDVAQMHRASTVADRSAALRTMIAGQSMASMIEDFLDRSSPVASAVVPASIWNRVAVA